MSKSTPMMFSTFGSMRSPDASHEVRVLEKVLFGAKVRIIIDPGMPPDELRLTSPADDSVLSEINDIKVLEDGSVTYKASLKMPLKYITVDLRDPEGK